MQTGLPMPALSAFVGPLNLLVTRQGSELFSVYLPHILRNSKSRFFMNVYFEECFEMNINTLRQELGIVALK